MALTPAKIDAFTSTAPSPTFGASVAPVPLAEKQTAVGGDHSAAFQWAREQCPWDEAALKSACNGGHVEVLQWFIQHRQPCDGSYPLATSRERPNYSPEWVARFAAHAEAETNFKTVSTQLAQMEQHLAALDMNQDRASPEWREHSLATSALIEAIIPPLDQLIVYHRARGTLRPEDRDLSD
jgi:hypothetical protein